MFGDSARTVKRNSGRRHMGAARAPLRTVSELEVPEGPFGGS